METHSCPPEHSTHHPTRVSRPKGSFQPVGIFAFCISFPFFRTISPGMPRSRHAFPSGTARAADYTSQQAPRPEEYITQAAPRRPSAHAPPRAGLLLPDGWLRRLLAMESYDVIANQPVVIDNVSAGGRASRELGGREWPAGRKPFVIGDGRAAPRPSPPPPPAGLAAASGPRTAPYAASSQAAAGAGSPRFGAVRLAEVSARHPPEGRCPSLVGSGPHCRRGAC